MDCAKCPSLWFYHPLSKGKEQITGYQYEPWHLLPRKNNAAKVQHSGQALEEYVRYKDRSKS